MFQPSKAMLNNVKTALILRDSERRGLRSFKSKKKQKEGIEKDVCGFKRNSDATSRVVSVNILQRLP